MRVIRRMFGYTRFSRIRNAVVREKVGMTPIQDKMGEARIRQFGYIKRNIDAPILMPDGIDSYTQSYFDRTG